MCARVCKGYFPLCHNVKWLELLCVRMPRIRQKSQDRLIILETPRKKALLHHSKGNNYI